MCYFWHIFKKSDKQKVNCKLIKKDLHVFFQKKKTLLQCFHFLKIVTWMKTPPPLRGQKKIHLQSNDYYLKFNDIIMVNVIPNVFWMFFAGAYTYGSNCDAPCPSNCKDNICHNDHGTCYGCKPGWTGLSCTMSMICFIKKYTFYLVWDSYST